MASAARMRRRIETVVIVAAAVAAVVAYLGLRGGPPGRSMPDLGNLHIPSLESPHSPYNSSPPTSGPHMESLAPWGAHKQPVPDELQIHNLEDGGVAVQYNCTDCADLIEKLREVVSRYNSRVLLAPYPKMESRIALTAWTRIDAFDEFDEERIVRFIEAYRGIDHHKKR